MFFRKKKTAARSSNSSSLTYQLLDQRVLLAGDLTGEQPDLGTQVETPRVILSHAQTAFQDPARIVINDDIGVGGSREFAEPFDAVVELEDGCTGTLIAADVILTARHCEVSVGELVFFGDDANNPVYTATVASVFRPDGFGSLLDGGDVAILTLTAPVPTNVATPMRLIDATDSLVGRTAATVGYGFNGLGSQGHSFTADGFRWGGENIIDVYGTPADNSGSNIISTDFDDGSSAANTISGSDPTPLEFEATSSPGDSGGPLLVKSGSEWVIAGVLSGGSNSTSRYGDISWWTGTAIWRSDIESFGGVFVGPDVASIEFADNSFAQSGDISITVVDPSATGPVAVSILTGSGDSEQLTLTNDGTGTYTGSINSTGVGTGSSNDGTLQVVDNDIIVASYFDSDDGQGEAVTVTDTATVYIDLHGNDATTATAIDFPATRIGEIDFATDQDWFSFNASVAMEYDFSLTLGSLEEATLAIFDSSGVLQTTSGDSFSAAISWQPTSNGEYFLVVESPESQLGTYFLTGTETVRPSTIELSAEAYRDDDTISVTVDEPNSTGPVVVTFAASSGDVETLTLNLTGVTDYSAAIDAALGLPRSGDGTLQVSQGDTITVTYEDLDDGLSGVTTLSDSATILIDDHGSTFEEATAVALPASIAGELEAITDQDWFVFGATEGVQYELGFSLVSLTFGELTLYDTDGVTELDSTRFSSREILWTAPTTGKYYLSLDSTSIPRAGTYEVSVTVPESTVEFATLDLPQSGPISVSVR